MAISEHPLDICVDLYDHYEDLVEVKGYYGLLGIYALARTAEAAGDEDLWSRVGRTLQRFPDRVEHPHYNFQSYRIGGIAQALMVRNGRMPERADLVREYAEELMSAPRDADGILIKVDEPHDRIWIDQAMTTTPFLLHAGVAFEEPRYLDEAIHQSVALYDALVDPTNGLLHQCRGFVAPGVRSTDHWCRGNGRGHFALAELVRDLPTEHPRRSEVVDRFRALSEALLVHQSENGLWRQEIPMVGAWEESSGSGLIAYGFGVGLADGILERERWGEPLIRALGGLGRRAINADGSTELSCPATLCPGEGELKGTPEAYVELRAPVHDEPHGFAPLMLALTRATDVSVDRVELRGSGPGTGDSCKLPAAASMEARRSSPR